VISNPADNVVTSLYNKKAENVRQVWLLSTLVISVSYAM
jgi:hypothetical protein